MPQVQQLHMISIGNKTILAEDAGFAHGYDAGYETYYCYHRNDDVFDLSLLLFQLRNGWNSDCSEIETTGYIMGWFAAFYEQEKGQLSRSIDVNAENATSDSIQQVS